MVWPEKLNPLYFKTEHNLLMLWIEVKFLNTVYGLCEKSILPLPFYPILISIPLPLSFTLGTLQTHLLSKIIARAILQSCSSLLFGDWQVCPIMVGRW